MGTQVWCDAQRGIVGIVAVLGLGAGISGCGESGSNENRSADNTSTTDSSGGERPQVEAKAPAPEPRAPSVWPDVAGLARALADPMLTDPDWEAPRPEMDELYAAANAKLIEYGSLSRATPRVAALSAEASSAQTDFLAAHRQLHAASGAEGGVLLLGLGLVLGNPGIAFAGLQGAVEGADSYAAIQRGYAIAFQRNRGAQLAMRDVAETSCDSPVTSGLIGVDLDESWHGTTKPYDVLTLTNTSGSTIHHAVVEAVLTGADGSKARNIHYVERWDAGESMFARYGIGVTVGASTVGKQTVSDVQSVIVNVWSRDARSGPVVYQYQGAEETADVRRYLEENLTFSADIFDWGIIRYVWGIRLWLDGVPALPPCRVTARFHCGDEVIERYRDIADWREGQLGSIVPDGPALPSKPHRVDVLVSFPDNDYVWHRTFDFQASR